MGHRHRSARPVEAAFSGTVKEILDKLTKEVREATGDASLVVEVDDRPLLSSEKTPKWPDDFKGFGTNVKPPKAK